MTVWTPLLSSEQRRKRVMDHAATLLLLQSSGCFRNPVRLLRLTLVRLDICFVGWLALLLGFSCLCCRLVSLDVCFSLPPPPPPLRSFLFLFSTSFHVFLPFFVFFFVPYSYISSLHVVWCACWLAYVLPPHSLRSSLHDQITCICAVYLCFVACEHRARLSINRGGRRHGHRFRWMYIRCVERSVYCEKHTHSMSCSWW